tara:strand:+ start:1659 stop:2039 length:381 start_codon:yes stop_codon:yes gene_type:complete
MKKIILQFFVKHWKEVLLVLLSAGIFFKMQSDMNELQKVYEAARESYEQQIEGLQDIHEDELKARQEALDRYESELERIREKYAQDLRDIERKVEREERELESDHTEAPQEVIDEIVNQFGFEYVE